MNANNNSDWSPHLGKLRAEGQLSPLATAALDRLASFPLSELMLSPLWRKRGAYYLNISYPSMQAMGSVTPEEVYGEGLVKRAVGPLAVYIHIPFCTANCYYCHYYKVFRQPEAVVDEYLDCLEIELNLLPIDRIQARSLYFGGGTPSYLTPAQMKRLFQIVDAKVEREAGAEVSFEIHPEFSDAARLEVLRENGVTRINIGVESFDEEILKHENRRHSAEQVYDLYRRASAQGFDNINLDLIYGLKGQTLKSWEESLRALGELGPASATLYYLRLRFGTPEYKLWKVGYEFPHEDEVLLMHAMNFEYLSGLGYQQMPVDWFIRDDKFYHSYQDHNWRKTDETSLLGLGPSAYSYLAGMQYYNVNDLNAWKKTLKEGRLPIWRGERLSEEESLRRSLMLGIKFGVDRKFVERVYKLDVVAHFEKEWSYLQSLGLIEIGEDTIELSYLGKLFADEVGQYFYSSSMRERMQKIDNALISTTWPQFNK